ncbi:MAG: D-mannonate epimerase, partial [Candidatus Marinimicrobia bacterium]|nr:D-mannonate epimerase [Candidatus Neomarinimicrobiota bacterium]
MLFCSRSSVNQGLTETEIREGLYTALEKIGNRRKVLAIPPDFTRFHSRAGELTQMAYQYYHSNLTTILPALGTHYPMSDFEIQKMFGDLPRHLFRIHRWKDDLVT